MKQVKKKKQNWIFALMFAFIFVVSMFSGYTSNISFAETTYSSVVEDLQKDESFNVEDYPIVKDDYSLKVLTIAESVNDELFVYVYQPSGTLTASSINISKDIDNPSYTNYDLTLLDKDSSLQKYKVNDFEIEDSITRYYDISTIYRPFNSNYDKKPNNENTITHVDFSVAKRYEFTYTETGLTINVEDIDVIDITNKYVGFVRYFNGFIFCASYCNSYYVAFSTDKLIENLLEVDVYYQEKEYTTSYFFGADVSTRWSDPVEKYAYLKYSDKAFNQKTGLFGQSESWDRIIDIDTFISEENLTDEAKQKLQGKQWVLRFAETEIIESPTINGASSDNGHVVSDVSILRLMFETDGEIYNLGVVDNKQTGSNKADNLKDEIPWYVWLAIGIVLLILAIIYLPSIVRIVFKTVFEIIISILKCLWYLWTAPLSLFGWDD